jgi:hypothetical protein
VERVGDFMIDELTDPVALWPIENVDLVGDGMLGPPPNVDWVGEGMFGKL